ncbi:MAG: alpha/beta hydrolase [Verrucomicrobiota bacterium]
MNLFKKRWARLAARLVLYPLLGVLMLRWFEHHCVFQPSAALDAEAAQLGRPAEDVYIPVDKTGRIEAWFFPADPGGAQRSRQVFLVCHGNAGNISHRLDLCRLLLQTGPSVLVFDYRGYGRSSGRPSEENTCRDAQAAWQWLRQKGFAPANILGYGESLGGAVLAELALRQELGGIILQSTFTSVPDLGAELFPWLPVRLLGAIKFDTLRKLPRLKIPVLILHGRQDTIIPFAHAEKNFAAANPPKYFREIHGDHNDAIFTAREEILSAVKEFLLPHPPPDRPAGLGTIR